MKFLESDLSVHLGGPVVQFVFIELFPQRHLANRSRGHSHGKFNYDSDIVVLTKTCLRLLHITYKLCT